MGKCFLNCKIPQVYSFDWYDGQNLQNGAAWNALLSSEGNELFVTWTIDSTGIKCYKNGILVFMWDASFKTGGQWYGSGYNASIHPENVISTLVNNIFAEVATKGFEIGTKNDANGTPLHQTTIRNLKIGYSKTAEAIAAEAKKLQQITINFVDEENKPLHPAFVILEEIGLEYEIPTYEIPGYETETKVLSGTLSNTPEEYTLVYKQIGEEQLTELGSFINEGTGWSLARTWFNVANDLVGDYAVVVKYHMNGNLAGKTSSGDYCWRTLLPIVHKANNTNIRWILRYDWYSWQEQCGSVYGTSYIESQYVNDTGAEFKALIEDCDITTIFSRSDSTIKVYSIMTATSGSWAGKVYFYEAKLFGVSYEDIGIAFSGESAKGQFTSIRIA